MKEVSSELGDGSWTGWVTTVMTGSRIGSKTNLEGVVDREGILLFAATKEIVGLLLRECWKSSMGISSDLNRKVQSDNEIFVII